MTDKELLELAAKAAGWKWWRSKHGYWNLTSPEGDKHTACHNWPAYDSDTGEKVAEPTAADALRGFFDPENDSGQAFDLAVKLGMFMRKLVREIPRSEYVADPYAATRRATVRAAAEIGKATP